MKTLALLVFELSAHDQWCWSAGAGSCTLASVDYKQSRARTTGTLPEIMKLSLEYIPI